jgi:hypothetical protein
MTSTLRTPSSSGAKKLRRESALGRAAPPRAAVRRRWGRIGTGIAAAVFGAWLFAALYMSADDRREVLVLADDVARYEVLEPSDLRLVRVAEDADLAWIAGGQMDEVVGRVARTDLVAGSLLAEGHLIPAGSDLLGADEAVVGAVITPGDGPVETLRRGTAVVVVIRPAAGETGDPVQIDGWVYGASGEALNAREQPVELAVPRDRAAFVSAAAADRRLTIVALTE